jgi:hypothetical protein
MSCLLFWVVFFVSSCDPGAVCMVYVQPSVSLTINSKAPFPPEEIELLRNVVKTVGFKYGFEARQNDYGFEYLICPRQDVSEFSISLFFDPKEGVMVVRITEFPISEQSPLALTIDNEIAEQLCTKLGTERIRVELSPVTDLFKWPGLLYLGQKDFFRQGIVGQQISKGQLLHQYGQPDVIEEQSGDLSRMYRPGKPLEYTWPKTSTTTFFYFGHNRAVEINNDRVIAVNPISDNQWEFIRYFLQNNRKSSP